jgi:excinuclease ABC subunit A
MDAPEREPLLFSSKYSCPVCDYALAGTGTAPVLVQCADGRLPGPATAWAWPSSSIRRAWSCHPELSLAAGAMRGWDRRNAYYFQMITSLAKHYKFDVDLPWQLLPDEIRAGRAARQRQGGDQPSPTSPRTAGKYQRKHAFEGIIPNLERRYRETESAAVREELSKYISERPCPECGGARLNRSARNVFVADRPLPKSR